MKKTIALVLATAFALAALVFVPASLAAGQAPGCERERYQCRADVLSNDEGWVRTMLMLSVCDIAWGRCVLKV